ncbi:MAG TPA: hypothetical protein VJR92_13300 [Gemmatimonadaceae bacterium]|nr:hypothetical protein [Gemmatimonadaceae bacterium]
MTQKTHPLARALTVHGAKIGAGVGVLIAGVVALQKSPKLGAGVMVVGAIILAFGIGRTLQLANHESPERVKPLASDLPVQQQIEILQKGRWIMAAAGLPYGAWVAWDLYRLHTGQVSEVYVWSFIGTIYEMLGFWPAVLFMPTIVIGFFALAAFGLRRLRRQQSGES